MVSSRAQISTSFRANTVPIDDRSRPGTTFDGDVGAVKCAGTIADYVCAAWSRQTGRLGWSANEVHDHIAKTEHLRKPVRRHFEDRGDGADREPAPGPLFQHLKPRLLE